MSKFDPLEKVPVVRVSASGASIVTYETFPTVAAKVECMQRLAEEDSPYFDHVARNLLVSADDQLDALRRAHDWISSRIVYCPEDEEILISARRTMQPDRQCGSCGHHAILGMALVASLDRVLSMKKRPGVTGAIVTMGGPPNDPEHASLIVAPRIEGELSQPTRGTAFVGRDAPPYWIRPFAGAPRGWCFSETSEPAHFGEEPYRAAIRMGSSRARLTLSP